MATILEVPSATTNETIPVDLDEVFLSDSPEQLHDVVHLLRNENAAGPLWTALIEACLARGRTRTALEMVDEALRTLPDPRDHVAPLCLKANVHLALARKAPKCEPEHLMAGAIAPPKDPHHPEFGSHNKVFLKQEYWMRAAKDLENAQRIDPDSRVVRDLQAALAMAQGQLDRASKLWEIILADEPTHLVALMGKARCQFSQRAFRPALKTYQHVLRLSPQFLPDPRIGIGLCFWMLGDREKARRAWERSMVVHPESSSPSAPLLLGLLHVNASKNPLLPGGDVARAAEYERGLVLIQQAFKRDNTSSAAAAMGPLSSQYLSQGGPGASAAALKLAERMLAFADARLLVAEAHLARARAIDADPETASFNAAQVLASYTRAVEANPDLTVAQLGVAGVEIRLDHLPNAIFALEGLIRKQPKCVEALAALAAIQTNLAFQFHAVSDSNGARKVAKESYEAVLRIFKQGKEAATGGGGEGAASERVRTLAEDRDLYLEIARLWSDEPNVERSLNAYIRAAEIETDKGNDAEDEEAGAKEEEDKDDLYAMPKPEKDHADLYRAQEEFERALGKLGAGINIADRSSCGFDPTETDAVMTATSFNLAACYEALGEVDKAKNGYELLLGQHKEFVEAKARLALLGIKSRRREQWDESHELIKQALTSQPSNAELRALYTYFLVETGQLKLAREFAKSTLKELSRHDVYALCASGALYYVDARENKNPSKEAQKDRTAKYTRSAEYFDKALQISPQCAFAAQGLAIGLAEGALGNGPLDAAAAATTAGANGSAAAPLTEQQARLRNARDALSILTRVKESLNEASVYINIGHCHFARDEYDRAIENYSMASKRYLQDKSLTVLWYLSRACYHKAVREQSFADLRRAIEIGQMATDLNPKDLANVFNMAVLKQKGVEILYALQPEKRTSAELNIALEHLQASTALFEQLANDPTKPTPYPAEVPRQRRSYGQSLEKRFQAALAAQTEYEQTEQGKIEQARRLREAEQKRRDELEAQRLAQIQRQAEALAEQRRRMREEAEQWTAMSKAWADSDDEDGDGKKKRGGGGGGGKKRKSTKMKGADDDGFETAESTDDGGGADRPAKKKRTKKAKKGRKSKATSGDESRKMDVDEQYDDEDGDQVRLKVPKKRGKASGQIKSACVFSAFFPTRDCLGS
ncbi:TPR-like protein [Rhodotorula sp. JG-1b]|nr:TPR-like protein [Rhodotorula sp. JG-1b]